MTTIAKFTVPGEPTPKQRPRLGKHGYVYTPQATRTAEQTIQWSAPRITPAIGDIRLYIRFRTANHRRVDCDNLIKLVCDAGNGFLWHDDSQIIEIHATLDRGSSNPGTDIIVTQREAA